MLKPHEILFIITGSMILVSLPWLDGFGFYIWITGLITYFVGLLFFLKNIK